MNEQIPEWLKQEAERKYPLPVWDNDSADNYMFYEKEEKAKELQSAYIAGAFSRSGGVWVKELTDFINVMKSNQTLINGCDIETIHIPSLLHKIKELYDESPAADKGNAIEASDINSYWLKKLIKKTDEIKELKEGFIISLRVLKTMCEKAGLEMGANKAQELIDGLETKIDVKDIFRTQIYTNAPDLSNPSKNLLH